MKFNEQGLIPTIIQDVYTNEVLMLAYMNEESFNKSIATKETWFYSRSRKQLWHKGEISGHIQLIKEVILDCDGDTLLIKVEQVGDIACHTGERSCFHNYLEV